MKYEFLHTSCTRVSLYELYMQLSEFLCTRCVDYTEFLFTKHADSRLCFSVYVKYTYSFVCSRVVDSRMSFSVQEW